MKKLKFIKIGIILCIGIPLISCSKEGTEGNNEIKIGISVYKADDTFISMISKEIEKVAKEKEELTGKRIVLNFVDAAGNNINQGNQIDKFITQNYNVICVNLVDRTAASTIIDKAKKADIPIIFFNREPVEEDMERWDKLYYVGAQAEESARMQANIIIELYQKNSEAIDKNGDGKIQYIMLEGEPGHQDAAIRTEYSIKTIQDSGIGVEKLADDTANWQADQANEKMTQWLKDFGDKIEVVFSNNDEMALGAIHAIKAANLEKKPLVVGVDGTPEALEAIKNKEMTGTVISDSYLQGKTIFNLAYALTENIPLEEAAPLEGGKYVKTHHKAVTEENIDNFIQEDVE